MKRDLLVFSQTTLLFLFTFIALSTPSFAGDQALHADRIHFFAGYGWANLKDENNADLQLVKLATRFEYDIHQFGTPEERGGIVQFGLEPFVDIFSDVNEGVGLGGMLFFKYFQPFSDSLAGFIEAGAGPMYFGIDTYEQGDKGFNFNDEGGAGLQYTLSENQSLSLNYRLFHISNLGWRDNNGGINGNLVALGYSQRF